MKMSPFEAFLLLHVAHQPVEILEGRVRPCVHRIADDIERDDADPLLRAQIENLTHAAPPFYSGIRRDVRTPVD